MDFIKVVFVIGCLFALFWVVFFFPIEFSVKINAKYGTSVNSWLWALVQGVLFVALIFECSSDDIGAIVFFLYLCAVVWCVAIYKCAAKSKEIGLTQEERRLACIAQGCMGLLAGAVFIGIISRRKDE